MEEGFVIDQTHGGKVQSEWAEGEPVSSFWYGGLKLKGRERHPIITFRCERCGYLESYAPATS
jgi:hypothetical protein